MAIDIDKGILFSTITMDGVTAVAFFTDQDLAERHAKERGPDWIPDLLALRPGSSALIAFEADDGTTQIVAEGSNWIN